MPHFRPMKAADWNEFHLHPIVNATIELHDIEGCLVANTTTDEYGFYYFLDIKKGTYSVVVIFEEVEYEQEAVAIMKMITLVDFIVESNG